MNQLEHLKALRDKARIQTEQAKAVLQQQGEISESLDRLIEALEGMGGKKGVDSATAAAKDAAQYADSPAQAASIRAAVSSGDQPSLGSLIANLEDREVNSADESLSNVASEEEPPVTMGGLDFGPSAAAIGAATAAVAGDAMFSVSEVPARDPFDEPDPAFQKPAPVPAPAKDISDEEVVWIDEERPELPESTTQPSHGVTGWFREGDAADTSGDSGENADSEGRPKLEPIVWEISENNSNVSNTVAEPEQAVAKAEKAADEDDSAEQKEDSKTFEFTKLSDEEEKKTTSAADKSESSDDDKDKQDGAKSAIAKVGAAAATAAASVAAVATGKSALDKDKEEKKPEVADTADADKAQPEPKPAAASVAAKPPIPLPVTPPPPAAPPKPAKPAPPARKVEGPLISNIFFDANSAYLKESELVKLQSIVEGSKEGNDKRIVKIQGLEDLASSNDFKQLLSSRRVLAVKKKLTERGVEDSQLTTDDISLSDEGRILSPPSVTVSVGL